ncbi:MAG: tetratricopeptide repeat protein, partial [Chloroflexota bacterium]
GESQRYDMHPIVRHYAYDHFTDEKRRKEAHVQLAMHFVDAMPVTNKNVKTLEDLAPVIELYHHMVGAGNLDEALKLFYDRLHKALYYQFGTYQLYAELLRALFLDGEDKPPRLKKEFAQGWTLAALGNAYLLNGQSRDAVPIMKNSVLLAEKVSDKKNIAIGLGNVAYQQLTIGALSAAERDLRRYIELSIELDIEDENADAHHELGRSLSYRGNWEEAEKELSIALNAWEKQKEVQAQSVIWLYRALRFLLMARDNPKSKIENLKSSIECAQRALELADEDTKQRYSHPRDYVRAHWLLGAAYRMNTELTLAEENLSKALNLCRQINLVDHEADILLDLARLRYAQGDFQDAQEKASEALTITERSGYVLQGADVHLMLATLALEGFRLKVEGGLSDKEAAIFHAEEALRLATCDGPPYYYKVAYEEAERMLEMMNASREG